MKQIIPFLLLLIAFASCQEPKANSQTAAPEIKIVRDTIWIDVRTPAEFEAGHLVDAANIPLQVFAEQFPKLVPQKDKVIALYCRSGNRSGQSLKIAQELGYTKAYNAGAFSTLSTTRK